MSWFLSEGVISEYDSAQKSGWYRVSVSKDIGQYYSWLYHRGLRRWAPSMNGVHITFIAGEKDLRLVDISEMQEYIGRTILFSYENRICTNGLAFWLPVKSVDLDRIRATLGLGKIKKDYHLTLGNIKNGYLR